MRLIFRPLLLLPLALAAVPVAALAQEDLSASAAVLDPGDGLKPGGYRWIDEEASGPIRIVVNLAVQRAYLYRGATLAAVTTISSGRDGYETPTGSFTILEKQVKHRSTLYDAPMPYMQRLTWDGVSLHAGTTPGYPTSHGCVHLPPAFAEKLFAITNRGAKVTITDDPTAIAPLDGVVETARADRATPSPLASDAASVDSDTALRLAGLEQSPRR